MLNRLYKDDRNGDFTSYRYFIDFFKEITHAYNDPDPKPQQAFSDTDPKSLL